MATYLMLGLARFRSPGTIDDVKEEVEGANDADAAGKDVDLKFVTAFFSNAPLPLLRFPAPPTEYEIELGRWSRVAVVADNGVRLAPSL